MTSHDKGHYSRKHPETKQIDETLAHAIRERAKHGCISCAVAHDIARNLLSPPEEVGVAIDMLEIRLIKCQLGLFGYPQKKIVIPAKEISEELREEIEKKLKDGKLPCKMAWDIAKKLGLRKMEVSSACEALGIKIGPCQLGAF